MPAATPASQAAIQTTKTTTTHYKITNSRVKVSLFADYPPRRNRRFTPKEFEDELETAKAFHRPPRTFKDDPPFYPFFPLTPLVNFDLKYQ